MSKHGKAPSNACQLWAREEISKNVQKHARTIDRLLIEGGGQCRSGGANFERPFTPRTRLGIPPNFAKTRFGRFPTFHFSTSKIFSKLRTAVYPPRMAPFGLKLWGNAFQMVPVISFFDANNFFSTKFFGENFVVILWYWDTMILWYHDIMRLWYYDTMILWYHDTMILWYHDIMILWYYGTMTSWYYDVIIPWYYDPTQH